MNTIRYVVLAIVAASFGATAHAQTGNDDRARALFDEGTRLYAEGDYDAAATALEESYRLSARPALLYNLANVYERNGEPSLAAQRLRSYLPDAPETDRELIRKRIARLDRRSQEQVLARQETERLQAEVVELRKRPAPVTATTGSTPKSAEQSFALELGLAGASAAFLVTGLLSASRASAANSRAEASCRQAGEEFFCSEAGLSDLKSRRRWAIAADVSFGISLATAVTAGYLYLRKRNSRETAVVPTLGPDSAGVSLRASF